MLLLAAGLLLFLGVHSARIVAPDWRERMIGRIGEGGWKGIYALLSLGGLVLVGRGWKAAEPLPLYEPLGFAPALLLIAMPILLVLAVAGNLPAGRIRRAAGHPMLLATVGWGALHVLANGDARAVLLFGGFALWAALDMASLLRRERVASGVGSADGTPVATGAGPHGAAAPSSVATLPWWPDIVAVLTGLVLYAWLVRGGHVSLFGVSPLG